MRNNLRVVMFRRSWANDRIAGWCAEQRFLLLSIREYSKWNWCALGIYY